MGEAKAGWYDDGSGQLRWFDGKNWTNRFKEKPSPDPPPPMPGTEWTPAMDKAAAPSLQPAKSNGPWWLGCLGCLGVIIIVAVAIGINAGNNKPYDMNNEYEAIAQCEARIEKLLKAPSTAKFDSSAIGSVRWSVTGTVDAENSFGAMVRSEFGCTVVMDLEAATATTTVDFFE